MTWWGKISGCASAAVLTVSLAVPAAGASSDDEWCEGDGACSSEREYNFRESPVQIGDVTLCAPLSTCRFEGDQDGGEEQAP